MSTTATDVCYQWTDYQAHVRDELEGGDHDLVVLRSGYGGGKSRCGGQWIHRGAMADTHGEGESLVLAQDYEKGKSTTYSVFFKILPGEDTNPFKDGDPENSPLVAKYNKNDKMLRYVTGHVAWIGGADKWSRFAGGEYARIWCDEVGHYPPVTSLYELYEMLVTRQRTDVGPNTTLWTSTANGYNEYYDITERQVTPDGEPLPWGDRLYVVVASTEDNVLLAADGREKIIRQFKGTPREEQGLHGGFAAAVGLVYSQFTRDTHVVPEANVDDYIPADAEPIYGYDAGWDHPRVLVELYPTHYDQWLVTDLYYATEKPFDHLCNPRDETGWVYNESKPRTTVYCEHEPEHIQQFQRAGFRALKAEKSLDEGIPHVRGLLEQKGDPPRPGLLVSDRCTELIQEFLSYQEEHVGKSGDIPDHCLDAARYALFTDYQRSGSESVSHLGSMRDLL
jgi:hypothetical protein